jgi:hypothetical protein
MSTRFFEMDTELCQQSRYESSCSNLLVLVQVELSRFHQSFNSKLASDELPSCLYNMTATNLVLLRSFFGERVLGYMTK